MCTVKRKRKNSTSRSAGVVKPYRWNLYWPGVGAAMAQSPNHQANEQEMLRYRNTYELFVCLSSQEVKMLSPQHSVGKQVGKGHGWEGCSFLWPLQSQCDHSNEERRKPRPYSKKEEKDVSSPLATVMRSGWPL